MTKGDENDTKKSACDVAQLLTPPLPKADRHQGRGIRRS